MIAPQRSPLERNPDARILLAAYSAGQATSSDGWMERLYTVEGVDTGELSRLHGKLIALGLLDFQLSDRTGGGGVRYQVTSEGQQSLKAPAGQVQALENDEPREPDAEAA